MVVGDINLAGAAATAKGINGTAVAVEFDFADESSVQALVDRTVAEFGGVDGLYNVGADLSTDTIGRDLDLLEMDPAVWRRTNEVNLLGYALACRTVLPHFLGQGGGVIVNTTSNAAWAGAPRVRRVQGRDQRVDPPHRLPLGQRRHPLQHRRTRPGHDRLAATVARRADAGHGAGCDAKPTAG